MNDMGSYLAAIADPELRALATRLRAVIRAAAEGAVEATAYNMPAWKYKGTPVAGFAVAKGWVGFYPMSGSMVEPHADELAGFSTAKGTVRLTPQTGIPEALITTMVRERMAEVDAKGSKSTPPPSTTADAG